MGEDSTVQPALNCRLWPHIFSPIISFRISLLQITGKAFPPEILYRDLSSLDCVFILCSCLPFIPYWIYCIISKFKKLDLTCWEPCSGGFLETGESLIVSNCCSLTKGYSIYFVNVVHVMSACALKDTLAIALILNELNVIGLM